MTSNTIRQAKAKARKRAAGLVQVTEWIPTSERERFKQIAASMRAGEPLPVTTPAVTSNTSSVPSNAASVTSNVPSNTPAASGEGTRLRFNAAAKQLAIRLDDEGLPHRQICAELGRLTGSAPGYAGFSGRLKKWRDELRDEAAGEGDATN